MSHHEIIISDPQVEALAQRVLAEVEEERAAELSVREELMFIRSSLAWWRFAWRQNWQHSLSGFALGLFAALGLLATVSYWWIMGIAISLVITDFVLVGPWVERRRKELYVGAAITDGLRHLHGWRRQ